MMFFVRMKNITTHGILLRKTFLANDDGVLDFFTHAFGRITVFVPKLAKSKTKNAELDFFRLLDLELFEGRSSKRLRQVSTQAIFSSITNDYESLDRCFALLGDLAKVLPEEKPVPSLFKQIIQTLGHYDRDEPYLELFFWVKLLDFQGFCPRFDSVRGDSYFDVLRGCFMTAREGNNTIELSNDARQVLEFLRRSDFATFWEKRDNLPLDSKNLVLEVVEGLGRSHGFGSMA